MPAGSATCRCRTSRSATCSRPRATSPRRIIFDRLAKADPGNAGWQHDLSVSREKIDEVQQAQATLRR